MTTTWHIYPDDSGTALCGKQARGKPFDPKDDDKVCAPCVVAVLADHREACAEITALYGRLDAILNLATPPAPLSSTSALTTEEKS